MSKRLDEEFYENLKKEGAKKIAAEQPSGAVLDTSGALLSTPKPITPRNLFSHPDTHPVVLDMALLKVFQLDWFPWLSDTLFHEIEREFKTPIAEVNRLKLMAAKTLHIVNSYWDQWEVFEKVTIGLNGIMPQLDTMQPPDLPSLYAGVDIANSIRSELFGDEVKRYCAAVIINEGTTYAPPPLDFCQEFVSQPMYKCKDCDRTGSALPPFDGHCPTCSQTFEQDKAFSLKPDPEIKDKARGLNLEYRLIYDPQPTKKRFEELDKMSPEKVAESIGETTEDVEAARIIVAVDFMRHREKQLKEQLESLRDWLGAS